MVYLILSLLGLCFGSFVNALVWRLHTKRDFIKGRSECVHCHHELAWYDLVPVVSWLLLRGRCRYCHKPISWQYPLVELLTAGLFVASYILWPLGFDASGWALFGLWLVFVVMLVALAVYDVRWMLLPDKIVFPLIVLGLVFAGVRLIGVEGQSLGEALLGILFGIASVGGFYWVLYAVSKGAWVGFGDVKLGIFIGAVLGWQAGILSVVLANFIGILVILPGLLTGKLARTSRVPFGPFLIAGFLIAGLASAPIIDWYLSTIL